MSFPALVLHNTENGIEPRLQSLTDEALPPGEVTVDVACSSLNYKDGMVIKGLGRLVRDYPHVPGIDLAGTVASSQDARFSPGDPVILTGFRVGEMHWGGYAGRARVKADWLVPLPPGLSLQQAMGIGTAGLAAMLGVIALEKNGLQPGQGPVLVTGATGGVGSVAIAILAKRGYEVAASTGKETSHAYLKHLGATTIVDRHELDAAPERPLNAVRWSGCIDNVGSNTLANVLSCLQPRGSVAAIGLAGGNRYPGDVIPFLLRGVNLLGIDTSAAPMAERQAAWPRFANDLSLELLDEVTTVHALEELPDLAEQILAGKLQGRTVIKL